MNTSNSSSRFDKYNQINYSKMMNNYARNFNFFKVYREKVSKFMIYIFAVLFNKSSKK